ncbi:uncharacterized protein BYT42DRAFT_489729 [Radiomyces spectabilis]|uniref:uncharacterized protein n=1 Tax=Radiomyces spectabilis TaxID=64574 RepID=UPI0022202871|nr:uncharacterized protein BYT42DRAFT_489729 [Radiomyces spectabilis]KAI8391319.1 hypothetical protein BYT42DRAFT_489729 [Radiomyces spectabilis]
MCNSHSPIWQYNLCVRYHLGAGVTGLTTAVTLLQEGYKDVLVVGKHLPGDIDVDYTSPWAGASILSFAHSKDKRLQAIDKYSLKVFHRLADEVPEAPVMYCPGYQFHTEEDEADHDSTWVKDHYYDYLIWLVDVLKKLGGDLKRAEFDSIQQVIHTYKDAEIIVNCSGMGSAELKDVRDTTMYGIRGQTVLVKAPHIKTQWYRDGKSSGTLTYIIPRPGGNVICGGTFDTVNKSPVPDEELSKKILRDCYELCPDLTHGQGPEAFEIVSVNVGFRPGRKDGIRLEKETRVRSDGRKVTVCHNYGHSSHGFQSSWGSSAKVLELLKDTTGRLSKL